jgi:flagellar protein FliO/FliZ
MLLKNLRKLAPLATLLAGPAVLAGAPGSAAAAAAPGAPPLLPLVGGLLVVLALIPAAAWLMRRSGFAPRASHTGLRVVAQLPLGPRERVVIVEAGDRRWMLGVSAAGITRLGTLPPGEPPADPGPGAPGAGRFADVIKRFTSTP